MPASGEAAPTNEVQRSSTPASDAISDAPVPATPSTPLQPQAVPDDGLTLRVPQSAPASGEVAPSSEVQRSSAPASDATSNASVPATPSTPLPHQTGPEEDLTLRAPQNAPADGEAAPSSEVQRSSAQDASPSASPAQPNSAVKAEATEMPIRAPAAPALDEGARAPSVQLSPAPPAEDVQRMTVNQPAANDVSPAEAADADSLMPLVQRSPADAAITDIRDETAMPPAQSASAPSSTASSSADAPVPNAAAVRTGAATSELVVQRKADAPAQTQQDTGAPGAAGVDTDQGAISLIQRATASPPLRDDTPEDLTLRAPATHEPEAPPAPDMGASLPVSQPGAQPRTVQRTSIRRARHKPPGRCETCHACRFGAAQRSEAIAWGCRHAGCSAQQ